MTKLEERIKSLLEKYDLKTIKQLSPRQNSVLISTPQQILFHDSSLVAPILEDKAAVSLGCFYEYLTAGIHGGKPCKPIHFRLNTELLLIDGYAKTLQLLPSEGLGIDEDDEEIVTRFKAKPDIYDELTGTYYESKGLVLSNDCNLTSEQIRTYKALQTINQKEKINFVIHRHSLPGIKSKWRGTLSDLVKSLSDKTVYSIVFPFSIALALYGHDNVNSELVESFYIPGDRHGPARYAAVKDKVMDRLFLEPDKVIEELNLNPKNYSYEVFRSPEKYQIILDLFPPGEPVIHEMNSYPIMIIKQKNHDKWVRKFVRDYLKELGVNDIPF